MPPVHLPNDLAHEYADVNGIRMHYATAGDGDPVILLHGFPEFWYSWRHQVAALAPHYRVIAPDLRGYNLTDAEAPYDTDTLQADVLALMGHLGIERAHIIGHDWGGAIAWLLAMDHPEAVRSLAVCNIPHPAVFAEQVRRNPRQMLRSWYFLFFQLPWLPERLLASDNYHRLGRMLIRDCKPGTFTREDVRMFLESWRRQGLGGGINWYRAVFRDPPTRDGNVPVLDMPVTMIWGDHDRALGFELTEGTERYASDFTLHRVPGASHWVQQEEPELTNTLLLAHLERAADA